MQFVSMFMKKVLPTLNKNLYETMARLGQAIKTNLNVLALFMNGWYEIVKIFLLSK